MLDDPNNPPEGCIVLFDELPNKLGFDAPALEELPNNGVWLLFVLFLNRPPLVLVLLVFEEAFPNRPPEALLFDEFPNNPPP